MATAPAVYNATPPTLASCNNNYKQWKSLIKHWQNLSVLGKKQQSSAIIITLSGKALNTALQISETDLAKDDGVATLLKRLDTIYLKDELSEKFRALEAFETYRRPQSLSIRDFLIEFENKHFKVKEFGVTMSTDLLGFRLIKAANLSSDKEELVKATVTELNYSEVKSKMNKIFSDDSNIPTTSQQQIPQLQQDTFQTSNSDYQYESEGHSQSDEEDTYYTNRYSNKNRKRVSFGNKFQHRSSDRSSMSKNWRSPDRSDNRPTKSSKNPVDRFGKQSRCDICESINHWADTCPDRPSSQDKDTYVVHEIILHARTEKPIEMETLVSETWNSGLLDCGATRTVCGLQWFREYVASLPSNDRTHVTIVPTFYRFGDGVRVEAKESAKIPAYVGERRVFIAVDIVEINLPLLLSKAFLKRGKMKLDFDTDTLISNNETISLHTSQGFP